MYFQAKNSTGIRPENPSAFDLKMFQISRIITSHLKNIIKSKMWGYEPFPRIPTGYVWAWFILAGFSQFLFFICKVFRKLFKRVASKTLEINMGVTFYINLPLFRKCFQKNSIKNNSQKPHCIDMKISDNSQNPPFPHHMLPQKPTSG